MCFGGGGSMVFEKPDLGPLDPLRDPTEVQLKPVYGSASQRSRPRSVMMDQPTLLMRRQL